MESTERQKKPQEALPLNFGKRLAHTNKIVRDRTFKTLKKWLGVHPELQRLDYMKLWKGLYFCYWMSDKRPVQQELAVQIALLVNDVPSEKQNLWINAFWETMTTAWEKLDKHRVNKYLLFVRIVMAEAFKTLRLASWDSAKVNGMGQTIAGFIQHDGAQKVQTNVTSLGFHLQFLRIFWDELLPQMEAKPVATAEVVMQLIEPLCKLAEDSPVRNLVARIHADILRKAPQLVVKPLATRVLALAGRPDMFQSNREALYETAEKLEKELRKAPSSLFGSSSVGAAAVASSSSSKKSPAAKAMSPLTLPKGEPSSPKAKRRRKAKEASAADEDDDEKEEEEKQGADLDVEAEDDEDDEEDVPPASSKKRKAAGKTKANRVVVKKKKKQSDEAGGPSPLLLPKSAVPIVGGKAKKGKKK